MVEFRCSSTYLPIKLRCLDQKTKFYEEKTKKMAKKVANDIMQIQEISRLSPIHIKIGTADRYKRLVGHI